VIKVLLQYLETVSQNVKMNFKSVM